PYTGPPPSSPNPATGAAASPPPTGSSPRSMARGPWCWSGQRLCWTHRTRTPPSRRRRRTHVAVLSCGRSRVGETSGVQFVGEAVLLRGLDQRLVRRVVLVT